MARDHFAASHVYNHVFLPYMVNKFVAFFTKSDGVWVPLNLRSLEVRTVLCKCFYDLIYVHFALHT